MEEDSEYNHQTTVAGMGNRQKLQRHKKPVFSEMHSKLSKRYKKYNNLWAEIERKNILAYEYLCHLQEVKIWIEEILEIKDLGPIYKLEEVLQDGVILAKLMQKFAPNVIKKIYKEEGKLKFKNIDNVTNVFLAFEEIGLPKTFWFELTDLFEKKNIVKVMYTINALSHLLKNKGLTETKIENLVGKIEFSDEIISITQGKIEKITGPIPKFEGIKKHFNNTDNTTVNEVQSYVRLKLTQSRINSEFCQLDKANSNVVLLKHCTKAKLFSIRKAKFKQNTEALQHNIELIQNLIKNKPKKRLLNTINVMLILQSLGKKHLITSRTKLVNEHMLLYLQSLIRNYSFNLNLTEYTKNIQLIQIFARKKNLSNRTKKTSFDLKLIEVINSLCRMKIRSLESKNIKTTNTIISLIKRMQTTEQLKEINRSLLKKTNINKIYELQALLRGELTIDSWYRKINKLGLEEDIIAIAQAIIRRHLVFMKYTNQANKYQNKEISKLQALIRAKLANNAYYELAINEQPKIQVIKSFLHLIEDSEKDYLEELQLEKYRMQIIRIIKQNRSKEDEISNLDVKIGLLVRNKISLDEVIKSQNSYHPLNISKRNTLSLKDVSVLTMSSPNLSIFKAVDKQSQERLQHYCSLFYILQTCPIYLSKLLITCLKNSKATSAMKAKKLVESVVLTLFKLAQNQREEFLLLKLFKTVINEELACFKELELFLKSSPHTFSQLACHYNRGIKERVYLRELLRPMVKLIIEDDKMDLETDPVNIYKSLVLDSNKKASFDTKLETALNHTETKQQFISNLQQLRNICSKFVDAIIASLDQVPYGTRYISKELKEQMQSKYRTQSSEEMLVKIVGNLVYYRYINPAIVAPELFDVIEQVITPQQRKNLSEIAKLLNQISMGKLFESENIYMQPLNAFVVSQSNKLAKFFNQITNVESLENHFQMDEYYDLTTYQKPTLFITQNEILTFHQLIKANIAQIENTSGEGDVLRTVIEDLGPIVSVDENDSLSEKEIVLKLNTKFIKINNAFSGEQELFIETKRCVIHILKVQVGNNLLDILNSETTQKDEIKHKQICAAYPKNNEQESNEINPQNITFSELKTFTLENMEKLEQCGMFNISRENNYQQMIRYIALDVKHKNKKRIQRSKDLSKIKQTKENLINIAHYLDDQIHDYSSYIQTCVSNYAKGKKQKRSLPFIFSRQYIHNKKLERSGKKPLFNEYKYNALKLHRKGIIKSIENYNNKEKMKNVTISISSNEPAVFIIKVSINNIALDNSTMSIKLEQLLQYQYENITFLPLFNNLIEVNVDLLLNLINKKFYT